MQFKEVIGQVDVKKQLAEMIQQNRLSHALLFLAKEGTGGLPLALAFAQYICCERVQSKNAHDASPSLFGVVEPLPVMPLYDACGVCSSCTKARQHVHPDIHFSYPVIPKKSGDKPKSTDYASEWREFINGYSYGNVFDWLQFIGAENKQGNITSEECNDIIHKLSLKSFESPYKILVMWMPEYLGKEGNKLLKLIEEPPPNTLFILVAENEEHILPTILSRCQLVKIPLLETNEILERISLQPNIPENTASQVSAIAEGNFREALQLLQHSEEDWQALLTEWLGAVVRNGPAAQVKWIEDISKMGREKQKQFLKYFNHMLEQGIRLRVLGENIPITEKDKDLAQRLNRVASVSQQQVIIEELDKASYYIERNANAKMLFHALTIKLMHIIKHKTLILTE